MGLVRWCDEDLDLDLLAGALRICVDSCKSWLGPDSRFTLAYACLQGSVLAQCAHSDRRGPVY